MKLLLPLQTLQLGGSGLERARWLMEVDECKVLKISDAASIAAIPSISAQVCQLTIAWKIFNRIFPNIINKIHYQWRRI